jgi:hypothetical protein
MSQVNVDGGELVIPSLLEDSQRVSSTHRSGEFSDKNLSLFFVFVFIVVSLYTFFPWRAARAKARTDVKFEYRTGPEISRPTKAHGETGASKLPGWCRRQLLSQLGAKICGYSSIIQRFLASKQSINISYFVFEHRIELASILLLCDTEPTHSSQRILSGNHRR